MQMYDGKLRAQEIDIEIKAYLRQADVVPNTLAIVLVGDHEPSKKYVALKKRYCDELGIPCTIYSFPANITESSLTVELKKLSDNVQIGSIIVQLPLPELIPLHVLDSIDVDKDVDCITTKGRQNDFSVVHKISPVVRALQDFIATSGLVFKHKRAVVVGEGFLVGIPVASYLRHLGILVDSYTEDKPFQQVYDADLVVLSAGVPKLVYGSQINEGASVVDFGSSVVDGKIVGDFDLTSAVTHLNFISPSPGGMGPLVIRYLIMNHLKI